MILPALQRPEWRGEPVALGDAWRLRRRGRDASCGLLTHPSGWELRVVVDGELRHTQVCRTQEEVLSTAERWKAAFVERGWA